MLTAWKAPPQLPALRVFLLGFAVLKETGLVFFARISRGSSFDYAATQARSAKRLLYTPDHLGGNTGLRPARKITP